MRAAADSSERLVCAVLAAQVSALGERIDTGVSAELLWRTTDALTLLSGLVVELLRCRSAPVPELSEQCTAAVAAGVEIRQSLDTLAFMQAQKQDFARQMVDCIVTAMERLAPGDAGVGARLSPHDLASLYVSEDQRTIHDAVVRRFNGSPKWELPASARDSPSSEGSGR
jgi:hypothetical protein